MSASPYLSTSSDSDSDSDEDELMELLMDDTEELMMIEILKEEQMLLELAQKPSRSRSRRYLHRDHEASKEHMLLELAQKPSRSRSRRYLHRDHEAAHARLMKDYFGENPTWCPITFQRRFRMRKELFTRIANALESHDKYFQWRVDATGRKGLSPLLKCVVAIRQLAFGGLIDRYDEDFSVGESTAMDCLLNFCRSVIDVFGEHYLRKPNVDDCQRLIQMHEQRYGFPGMLGSLDCMHWEWKNCPLVWKYQYTAKGDHSPIIMFEGVVSADLWIWHAFFGVVGSNNDINELNQSPFTGNTLQGSAPDINFTINGAQYTQGYYLTDKIYPKWTTFVKSFECPQDPKKIMFKEMQEAARKDVERAFEVLQARWTMIKGPSRLCYKSGFKDIIFACIVLHNMIIEDEGDTSSDWVDELNTNESSSDNDPRMIQGSVQAFNDYLMRGYQCDREKHRQLRADLVEHVWARYGNS